ncbi:hypothetical protein J4410_04800 [Candidatus Woesearchaeota archaeon]|nr:hypothetical protein [Candidatus Woesearchaeota archaeon]
MTIISDSTGLILLAKVGILEIFTEKNEIIVPEKVYEEIRKGKEKGRADAFVIERLVAEKKIKVKKTKESTKKYIEKLFNIKKGELEVIALAFKTKNSILTDDMKCIRAAKSLDLEFMNSLGVIVSLQHKGRINKSKALEAINKLEEFGWYTQEIIKTHRGALQ